MSAGVDTADERLVAERATEAAIEVCTAPDDPWTRVNGTDVSRDIRTEAVSAQVSVVARVQAVRDHLIAAQRAIISSAAAGIVAEGRDIGTVVAPDAQLKVFLTADPQARARRGAAAAGGGGGWAEGRAIATVVAPAAKLKVFLTADPQARARRRAAERGAAVDATEAAQARRDRLAPAPTQSAGVAGPVPADAA